MPKPMPGYRLEEERCLGVYMPDGIERLGWVLEAHAGEREPWTAIAILPAAGMGADMLTGKYRTANEAVRALHDNEAGVAALARELDNG